MSRPLHGLRVLDAGMNVAGPIAASILGDLGAEVIKIEPPRGDTTRQFRPSIEDASAIFAMANHNKQLISLDLRTSDGRAILADLLATVDVLIENLRPGKSADLGLDPAACHAINAGLIHGSIVAFHPSEQGRPGYDLLVQAESGIMDLTGPANGPPARLPGTMIDQVAGLWLAQGILAELYGRRVAATVRVALIDVAVWLLGERVVDFLATGVEPHRFGSSTAVTTPHGAFEAADGQMVIGAASDEIFQRLAAVLGPPVGGDLRFSTQAGRLQHRIELEAAVNEALSRRTVQEWLAQFEDAGVPAARLRTLPDAVERHERLSATGLQRSSRTPPLAILAPPVTVSGPPWQLSEATGPVGRDTQEVLADIGIAPSRVSGLIERGVIPPPAAT